MSDGGVYYNSGNIGGETPNRRFSQPDTYVVLTPPASLPITLEQAKEQLNIVITDISFDAILTLYIEAVRTYFESLTGRILINTQFRTFFTNLVQSYELRRSKLVSLDSFQYLDLDDVFVDFNSNVFYTTDEADYSRIILERRENFPNDKKDQFQSIRADFTSGFGIDDTFIPSDIKIALLNHVANMFANRGDCSCTAKTMLPLNAKLTYNQYKVMSLYGGTYRGSF